MVNASPQLLGSIVSALSSDTVPSGPYRNWPPFFFDGCHRRRRWSSYYVSTRLGPPPVPPIARCPSCCCSQVASRLMRDAETSITLLSGTVHLQPPNKPVAPLQYPAPLATLPTSSCPLYANPPEACLFLSNLASSGPLPPRPIRQTWCHRGACSIIHARHAFAIVIRHPAYLTYRVVENIDTLVSMVYCGKPSRGCQMCRTRRIKVSL